MTTIDAGDIENFGTATEIYFRVVSGEVKYGSQKNALENAALSVVPDMQWVRWLPADDETLYLYAVEDSEVETMYNDGFRIEFLGFAFETDPDTPNIPDIRDRTTRIPYRNTVEVDADQSTTLNDGQSETSTVTADPDEVWELAQADLSVSATGGSGTWTIDTEGQGATVAFANSNTGGQIPAYDSGEWRNFDTERDNMLGTQITDTEGLQFTYTQKGIGESSSARRIRLQFLQRKV